MEEYLIVGGTLLAHHGGSYLAQAHAMPPTGAVEDEARPALALPDHAMVGRPCREVLVRAVRV